VTSPTEIKFSSLHEVLDFIDRSKLFGQDDSPMFERFNLVPSEGTDSSNMALVIGPNAAGKSLLRRLVQGMCKRAKVECMHLSMEGRTAGHMGPMRGMVYGGEDEDSTGVNSLGTILGGIRSSKGRGNPHIIFWDEPDVGLSDEAAAGAALEIVDYLKEPDPMLVGVFVVTHRRAMLEYLAQAKPLVGFLGPKDAAPSSLKAWVERPIVPIKPEAVKEEGLQRWRAVNSFLKTV
jgi:hypothetical protein